MSFLTSGFGDWFGSGFDLGGSGGGGGSGIDWGDAISAFTGGLGSGDSYDGGSSGGSALGGFLGSLFGGGSGSSGSNIFASILGGLGGMAEAKLSGKDAKELVKTKGIEDRKTLDFEAALKDYYTQEDKRRKRIALDTYGQFSLMNRIQPGYQTPPPVNVPQKPTAG